MIHWYSLDLSLPLFVPTSGMVALYLIIGMGFLLFVAVTSLDGRRGGYCSQMRKDRPLVGLTVTLLILVVWPVAVWLVLGVLYRYLRRHWRRWLMRAWRALRGLVARALGLLGDDRLILVVSALLLAYAPFLLMAGDWLLLAIDVLLGSFLLICSWRALGRQGGVA